VELAGVLMDMGPAMGTKLCREQVLEQISLLIEDENTNVRLCVINKICALIEVVGMADEIKLALKSCFEGAKAWRLQHAVLLLFPDIYPKLEFSEFIELIGEDAFKSFATNRHYLIRRGFVEAVAQMAEGASDEARAQLVEKTVLPLLEECGGAAAKDYLVRCVPLYGLELLGLYASPSSFERLLKLALAAAEDKVPNLRHQAVLTLRAAGPLAAKHEMAQQRESIKATLDTLSSDDDIDVAAEAKLTLDAWDA